MLRSNHIVHPKLFEILPNFIKLQKSDLLQKCIVSTQAPDGNDEIIHFMSMSKQAITQIHPSNCRLKWVINVFREFSIYRKSFEIWNY